MPGFLVSQVYIGHVKDIKRLHDKRKRGKIDNEINVQIKDTNKLC